MSKPKIIGYSTLMSPEAMKLPYLETLLSWSSICDKICICYSKFPKMDFKVPDGAISPWENDNSWDILSQANKDLFDNKLVLVPHDWDPDEPLEDGITKQIARHSALNQLEGDNDGWTAHFDGDELLRDQDVQTLIDEISADNENEPIKRKPYLLTGILEFFGGTDKVRFNFGNWIKIRMTRNMKELIHGIPLRLGNMAVRARNPNTNKIISYENRDDGAGFISSLSLSRPEYSRGLLPVNIEVLNAIMALRNEPPESPGWIQVPLMLKGDLNTGVWLFHTSWIDIKRKWEMGWHFDNFWAVLNGKQDHYINKNNSQGTYTRTNSADSEEDLQKELTRPQIRSINKVPNPSSFETIKQWRELNNIPNPIPGIDYGP